MKKNKEDFFEQMESYKTSTRKQETCIMVISLIFTFIMLLLLILFVTQTIEFTQTVLIIFFSCGGIIVISLLSYLVLYFKTNNFLFSEGYLSAGIKNLVIIVLPIYLVLFILYLTLPNWREILIAAFTITATISTATLTIMGVHYTLIKRQNENKNNLNLIFSLSDSVAENLFKICNAKGDKTIQLTIKNISNNYGYLVGLYRICGCNAYSVGNDLPYFPIAPKSNYTITDIKLNFGDDQLIIVYQDICENYYYLLISSNYQFIESAGKCDINFLDWRLDMTEKSEQKSKNKLTKQPSTELITDENFINGRKEATKPINTIRENGFDLVVSSNGTILTDKVLLNKLKKERIRLAKEQKVKAYMIFNNQQLVALATYKPIDELSFISIYGLGKKKFELYGDLFLSIIAEHNLVTN